MEIKSYFGKGKIFFELFLTKGDQEERPIRATPPIRSRVSPNPDPNYQSRNPHESIDLMNPQAPTRPNFNAKRTPEKRYIRPGQDRDVLDAQPLDRQEYLNRSKSPPAVNMIFIMDFR